MGFKQQELAVDSGAWVLYRYDPRLIAQGKNPLQLDSKEPKVDVADYMYNEVRFRALRQTDPDRAAELLLLARQDVRARWNHFRQLAELDYSALAQE